VIVEKTKLVIDRLTARTLPRQRSMLKSRWGRRSFRDDGDLDGPKHMRVLQRLVTASLTESMTIGRSISSSPIRRTIS
jgi:hypothetical protein